MRSSLVAALLLSGSAFAAEPRSTTATATACTDSKSKLLEAAKAQGLALNAEQIGTLSSDTGDIVATSIAGFENVPDTEYAKGVDVAFVYIDSADAGVPAGYYRVNVRADPKDMQVGKYKAVASLIDASGKEVAQRATRIETFSAPLKSARYGSPMNVGLQQQTIRDYNLTRFFKTVTIIMVRPWGTVVIDLFGVDYSDYYGF
ncbi:hypothetical protein JYK02_04460 [Corallococcus macrosporus]|uniref:Uncharacterized protein n=1 Tax=Corallococcus macrosporus TaxID=35 RepID=A0ABS3D7Y4_9BACT|nr:hypothetical protein [Corallococcus macrosporus]MBN8226757.1 hypothetical protein [Corallococcus macrosporus]